MNEQIVHGMPSTKNPLKKGDVISIDTGVDWMAILPIQPLPSRSAVWLVPQHLLDVTKDSLEMAIDKVREGNRLFDICSTVQKYVRPTAFPLCASL